MLVWGQGSIIDNATGSNPVQGTVKKPGVTSCFHVVKTIPTDFSCYNDSEKNIV